MAEPTHREAEISVEFRRGPRCKRALAREPAWMAGGEGETRIMRKAGSGMKESATPQRSLTGKSIVRGSRPGISRQARREKSSGGSG